MRDVITNWRWLLLILSILAHVALIAYIKLPDTFAPSSTTEILITFKQPEAEVEASPAEIIPEPEIPVEPERQQVQEVVEIPQPETEPVSEIEDADDGGITSESDPAESGVVTQGEGDSDPAESTNGTDTEQEPEETSGNDRIPEQGDPVEPEPEIDIEALITEYSDRVRQEITNVKSYPPMSRRLGETGSVLVNFTVTADGELSSVTITESSGLERLDRAAMDAVRNAAPFDTFPPEIQRDSLAMSITLIFDIS